MKSTWTLNENSTGELLVEVNTQAWAKAQDKALETLSKDVEVQGFRKGQAPKNLAQKQIGTQTLLNEAINNVANDAFVAGIVEQGLEPVAQPSLDIKAMSDTDLTLAFTVTVKPEVTLGEYKGIVVPAEDVSVTEEMVSTELDNLREENAQLVVLEDTAVETGHTVIIDFEGFKDDVAFEGGKGENHALEIGSNSFIPGFEEQLVGMKPGESKDVELSFPDTYHVEDLKGEAVVFKVALHEVKTRELPELNDDLAELLEDDSITTLDELKASIKERLEKQAKETEEDRVNNELVLTISENATVAIPEAMVAEEVEQMFNEFNQRLAQQGMNIELYTQILGQTEEGIKEEMQKDAHARVRSRLVLEKIAQVEELKVEDKEIEEEFNRIAEMYGMELEQIKEIVSLDAVQYDMLLRKAMELVTNSKA